MPTLEEMLTGALGRGMEADPPRLGEVESLNRLREHLKALDLPVPNFTHGQRVRFKPSLHMNLYSQENQVFVFLEKIDPPLLARQYVEELRDALSPFNQWERDCLILALDSDNQVVRIPVSSKWLEAVE